MYCSQCGQALQPNARFCTFCGHRVENAGQATAAAPQPVVVHVHNTIQSAPPAPFIPTETLSAKNKWVALVLCAFLGWLGVHRFYAGKIGTGLVWMCSFGCFACGWLVDFFVILSGKFRDGEGYRLT